MKQGFYKNIMHAMTQILSGLLAAMMLVSIVGVTGSLSVKANNYTDTYYSLKYYGDGGDVRTGSRTKTDDSYVYIKHLGTVGVYASVRVVGMEGKNYTGMNGKYKNIYLGLSPATHSSTTIYGWWSPDSI